MTATARALRDALAADWPVGRFDAALPLLAAYCELIAAVSRIDRQIAETSIGSARWYVLVEGSTRLTLELVDMAAALGLLPGDRHLPPPRLQ